MPSTKAPTQSTAKSTAQTRTTMKERIAQELAAGKGPDAPVAPAIEGSHGSGNTSTTSVGNVFDFSSFERSLIRVIIGEYDKSAKAARRTLQSLNVSVLDLDVVRSRCALITERLDWLDTNDTMELTYPLRVTLGDALSLHARKLAKISEHTLPDMLVDTNDVSKAADATQHIANTIGEQLVLFLPSEDDEK